MAWAWNILIGIVAVAAAKYEGAMLPGTNSPTPLMALGAGIALLGVFQFFRRSRGR
jgi:hypothetical protein